MLKVKLLEEINKKGLSSRQAAKEMNVSHTTVVRILRGDIMDLATILKVSEWLGVKPATLINSLPASALPEQIDIMLGANEPLKNEFAKALKAIIDGKVTSAVIEDIVSYAAYKINLSRR